MGQGLEDSTTREKETYPLDQTPDDIVARKQAYRYKKQPK